MARALFHNELLMVKLDVVRTLLSLKTKHVFGFTGVSSHISEFIDEFHQWCIPGEKKILPENKLGTEVFLPIFVVRNVPHIKKKERKTLSSGCAVSFPTNMYCTASFFLFFVLVSMET